MKGVKRNEAQKISTPPPFRAHDCADPDGLNCADKHCLGLDKPHAPTADELTEIFKPIPFVPARSLRYCAEKLLAAIDAREKADKDIEFYTTEIRRLA
ncbi:MAG: hypothetical protein AB9917_02035 [Negativicutes bacterium]